MTAAWVTFFGCPAGIGEISMAEEMSREESEHMSFHSFHHALQLLALPAEAASGVSGSYNTAWELKRDIAEHPLAYLADSSFLGLTPAQISAIEVLAKMVSALPDEAISPRGVNTRTIEGDIAAMKHPAWDEPRSCAAVLIETLKPVAVRNQAYFEQSRT